MKILLDVLLIGATLVMIYGLMFAMNDTSSEVCGDMRLIQE